MFVAVFFCFSFPLSLIAREPDFPFFPAGSPNFIYVYLKMPVGTKAEENRSGFATAGNQGVQTFESISSPRTGLP